MFCSPLALPFSLPDRYPQLFRYLLHSLKAGIRVRDMCKQYRIETLRQYRQRSREQINEARIKGKKI